MPNQNKELIANLRRCGVKKNEAAVVEFLSRDHEYHSLREIERGCDLRQPEVSIVVSAQSKFIESKTSPNSSKRGRPVKHARMTNGLMAAYLDRIKTTAEQECKDRMAAVASLVGQ